MVYDLNFDDEHFRHVISKSSYTKKAPCTKLLLTKATEKFYDEFDYHPNFAVCAPGTFTILGEFLDLIEGPIMQAALPLVTLIVGGYHDCPKARIVTMCCDVDKPNRILMPLRQCQKFRKGCPTWANVLKGVNNYYLRKNKKGLDIVINSSIPVCRGFGSSVALEAAFIAVLDSMQSGKHFNTIQKAKTCRIVDEKFGESTKGWYSSFTTHTADIKKIVITDTRDETVMFLDFPDPNILFLITMPVDSDDFVEVSDDLLRKRMTELKLAARLIGLKDIRNFQEKHLEVLDSLDDPTPEKVTNILEEFEDDKEYIAQFVQELFTLPQSDKLSLTSQEEESEKYERGEASEPVGFEAMPPAPEWEREPSPMKMDQFRTAPEDASYTTFEYKMICDETVCPVCQSDLTARSDLTVMSKLMRRVRYLVTERMRIENFMDYVQRMDYVLAGYEITRSHLSLKVDFEVSSPIMDDLIEFTAEFAEDVFGSKMMRNGCTLTMLHRNRARNVVEGIRDRFGYNFEFYLVFPSRGMRTMKVMPQRMPCSLFSNAYPSWEELLKRAVENFEVIYSRRPTHGYYAPGALKMLGDHSDFNQTCALTMSVTMVTLAVGALNGSGKIRATINAEMFDQPKKVIFQLPSVQALKPGSQTWANYVRGTVSYFKGFVPGFDCHIESSLPMKGKLTGTAALQIAVYGLMEELTGTYTDDNIEKAARCMKGEHEFTNTMCGIDDYIAALEGREHKLIFVDCKNSTFRFLPAFDLSVVFVLICLPSSTKVTKSLLYMRLEECYDVTKALRMNSLRCAKEEDLENLEGVPEMALRRARHVITETARVMEGARALQKLDIEKFGCLMIDSHKSLRDNFDVSHRDLDEIVERSLEVDGVLGAKMSCVDYGNSVICFVKKWAVDDLIEYVQCNIKNDISYYVMSPMDGSKPVDIKSYNESLPGPRHTFESIFGC